jgi:hypothetical protein
MMKINLSEKDKKELEVINSPKAWNALNVAYSLLRLFSMDKKDLDNIDSFTKPWLKKYYLVLTPQLEKLELLFIQANNIGLKVGINKINSCRRTRSSSPSAIFSSGGRGASLGFTSQDYIISSKLTPEETKTTGGLSTGDITLPHDEYFLCWFFIEKDICDRLTYR